MSRHTVTGRRTLARVAGLVLLACSFSAPDARAQGSETLKALAEYRLTMPTVRKILQASGDMEKHPEQSRQVRDATRDVARMSIGDAIGVIERYPAMKQAVARTGLSAREFATALLSFHWAVRYLAEEQMRKAQGQTPPGPPAHVPKENVELVRTNMEEIERLAER